MKKLAKFICLMLTVCVLLLSVGCGSGNNANNNNASSDNPDANNGTHRPIPEKEEEVVYEDNDHLFDYKTEEWSGPEGYVIVVPKGNSDVRESAELLRDYYKNELGIKLSIVTDEVKPSDKEIIIGKTTRDESDKDIKESDIKVYLNGDKLIFDAGHNVTVDSAVKKYIRLAPKANETNTFSIETDFVSELDDGYKYVWGDEFEGIGLDNSNWELIQKMAGNEVVEVSTDKDVVDVQDGRLKMHAISYFNKYKQEVEYRVPCSVVTQNTMNFVYGYAEIRARVPYSQGVWASWWTQAEGTLGPRKCYDYMLEIDIYEIFKTYEKTSYLLQWFSAEFDYNKRYEPDLTPGVSTCISSSVLEETQEDYKNVYRFEASPSLNYEYHIYGFEWTPTEIIMTVDGTENARYDITKAYSKHEDMTGFHDPQFFIFNNHLFYPGVSESDVSISTSPQSLPACHYIDYIRLYQKDGQGKLYTAD